MTIAEMVAAFAPVHVEHGKHAEEWRDKDTVNVKCGCSVMLTFYAKAIAMHEHDVAPKVRKHGS
jgi:hypothetical protein